MSSAFISLVGLQPSAMAVCLKGWINHIQSSQPLSRVVLLSTQRSEVVALRLKEWICSEYTNLPVENIPVSNGLAAEGDRPSPPEAIKEWRLNNPEYELIFNIKPGLNFQISAIAHQLPEDTIFLSPMVGKIYRWTIQQNGKEWAEIPILDLGLDLLLRLYQIPYEITNECSEMLNGQNIPGKMIRGLKLTGVSGRFMEYDLAFEKEGYLYALKCIDGAESEDRKRQFRSLHSFQNDLNYLRTQVAVLSKKDEKIMDRAVKSINFSSITMNSLGGRERLYKWLRFDVPEPGHQEESIIRAEQSRVMSFSDLAVFKQKLDTSGKGGIGPSLAVCLGNDPSSTLISLYTHKPKKALIFYDAETPFVMGVANRLIDSMKKIPVGEVQFVETNIRGKGMLSRLSSEPVCRVDISPGTKEQGVLLTKSGSEQVWSIRGREGKAECILGAKVPNIPLEVPDILTQAYCAGGVLKPPNPSRKIHSNQQRFYSLLAKFMYRHLLERKKRGEPLTNVNLTESLECEGGKCLPSGERVCVTLDGNGESIIMPQKESEGGFWFEQLAAHSILGAGADEAQVGVEWAWPEEISKKAQREIHKNEIDVLAKFGHRFVAISCKAGKRSLSREKSEISSVSKNMGNFCIPILAVPLIKQQRKDPLEDDRVKMMDLETLSDINKLASFLKEAFMSYSTSSG